MNRYFTGLRGSDSFLNRVQQALVRAFDLIDTAIAEGLTSPLTTKGDLWTYDEADARLAVGADGTVLIADSAEPTGQRWGEATGAVDFNRITLDDDGHVVYTGDGDIVLRAA